MNIAFSDLHYHKYKDFNTNNRRLIHFQVFISYIFKLAHKNGVKEITFSGDLFNTMEVVQTETMVRVLEILKWAEQEYPDIHILAISGNHDQATKNTLANPAYSALMAVETSLNNFHLLDQMVYIPGSDNYQVCGLPYFERPQDFSAALDELLTFMEPDLPATLLMHQTMGFDIPGVPQDVSPEDPRFKKFKYVLNGHIHKHQDFGNGVFNVGSPMHRDAGDIGVVKGLLAYDPTDSSSYQFMDITDKFPQFISKVVGEELTEWEEKQYIMWKPQSIEVTAEEKEIVQKFTASDQPPNVMIDNFMGIKCKGIDQELMKEIEQYKSKVVGYVTKNQGK